MCLYVFTITYKATLLCNWTFMKKKSDKEIVNCSLIFLKIFFVSKIDFTRPICIIIKNNNMDAEEIMPEIAEYGYYYDTEYNKYVGENKIHLFIDQKNNQNIDVPVQPKQNITLVVLLVMILFVQCVILLTM